MRFGCFFCSVLCFVKKEGRKEGMNADSFPDCRSVLDDVLSGATHSDFPPELLRRTLNANKVYLHNPFAIHEVCECASLFFFHKKHSFFQNSPPLFFETHSLIPNHSNPKRMRAA